MRKTLFRIGLAVFTSIAQAEDIRPGLWKIAMESTVAATPDWKPQPFEITQCLTEKDAQNPGPLLLGMSSPQANGCDFPSKQASDGKLSFEVSCGGSLGIKGHGQITYTATNMDGFIEVNLGEAEKITMQNKVHATYIGDCLGPKGGL